MLRAACASRLAVAAVPFLMAACGDEVPAGRGAGGRAGVAGAAGTGAAGSGGGAPTASSRINLAGAPIYTRMQRLTNAQWERAVADVLRFAAPANLSQGFSRPPASPETDFTNNERRLLVDRQAEIDFEAGSEKAAELATGSADALATLYPGTDAVGFVRALGRRAFRRPLTSDEQMAYEGVFARGEDLYGPGFANGAALVIRAMLQSPKFLYRSELGPAGAPLDGYEIASKLSFWLLGTTPSDELLDAAAAGELDAVDGIERAARAMLERPDAVAVMRDFHDQLYRRDRDPSSERFFDAVFTSGEGLRAILTSTREALDSSRIGYFMQVPFLAVNGRPDGPDSMRRGAALADAVLCLNLPEHDTPPPPLPSLVPGETNRERVENVTARCPGCHSDIVNPLGFAFEGFDGAGQPRELDNGEPVDASGSFPFEDGARRFADARELMRLLADGAQAHTCYAKMLAGYALQRDIVESDWPLLRELAPVSREQSLEEMAVALVRSPAFRLRPEGAP